MMFKVIRGGSKRCEVFSSAVLECTIMLPKKSHFCVKIKILVF